jgi:hypothetical protein
VENILNYSKLLEIVEEKHKKSNGSCGTYFKHFLTTFLVSEVELNKIITILVQEKKVVIREGIHGKMIFSTQKQKVEWKKPQLKLVPTFPE